MIAVSFCNVFLPSIGSGLPRKKAKHSKKPRHCQPLHHHGEDDDAECSDHDFVAPR